jgi:CheY-like chemotaxis protein
MSKLIVWIEDDIDIIYPVVRQLENAGYKIQPYRSPAHALDAIEVIRQADLILLDLLMPSGRSNDEDNQPASEIELEIAATGRHEINGVNRYPGISLLRDLRQKYSINKPVIFLTVITKAETLEELKLLGVADIVRKPILPSELKERVERALHSCEHQA